MDATQAWFGAVRARFRWPRRLVAAGVMGALLLVSAAPVAAHDDRERGSNGPALGPDTFIAAWDATGSQAFTAAALTPPDGHIIFAYVAIAEYDAVMAIHPGFEPFAIRTDAPRGASAEAAVAAAAHAILVHYLPAQAAAILDPAYVTSLASIPAGQARADGVAVGEKVAAELIAQRANDGFRAAYVYTPPNPPIPGAWLPTASTPPIGTYVGHMRPFALKSADQFRPDGPPALGSKRWARDFNEVKDVGSSTSTTRTAAQTVAARFWAEPPVQQARGSFRRFILDHHLDVVQASRFNAMVSVVYADAVIACWDAKYHFAFWRPITAVRAGDTDGNPATIGDPSWSPLLAATPNHPEYPSAHSCITPAGGLVIARFLGTKHIDFTVPSLTGLGDRHFDTVKELRDDVSNGRIWGGIHYRSSVRDGAVIAKKTANYVLARYFQRVGDD
jgi:hypothetical protein